MLSFPKNCAVCGGKWFINHECPTRNDGRNKHRERPIPPEHAEKLEQALSRALVAETPPTSEREALAAVREERRRQVQKWGNTHDDEHGYEELARQAASFLQSGQHPLPYQWSHKSKVIDRDPRLVQLVKGAALAVAAIEAYYRKEGQR